MEHIKKNNKLLKNARALRREMTRHEKHLWYDFLQHYPIKIYKQKIIDNFIVDFYCRKACLIIELDGSQHYTEAGEAYDGERTNILESYGLRVLRFSNLEIDRNFQAVCDMIDKVIQERIYDD
ncbi:MAG: endonuclease domain-containing protein [Clostridia bacterium]|nr:endonuclease domain-containing protein [Clostridia bacterium]